MTEEMSGSFLEMIEETLDYCDQCESQVHDFIKVANCVLNREEYYEFLSYYRKFENNFWNFRKPCFSNFKSYFYTSKQFRLGRLLKSYVTISVI